MVSNRFTPVVLTLFVIWFSLSAHLRDPNNPPTGRTGAPGEGTCGDSGCHSPAGIYTTAKVGISGIPDTIVANQTYTLTLTNESAAVRAGFQLTCFDANNAMCGTLTAPPGSGVNIGGTTKKYARQSTPKNLSGGTTSWTFTWKAPAAIAGNKATFYFVSLAANGNGQRTGDNVAVNKKEVVLRTTSSAGDDAAPFAVRVYPTVSAGPVYVETEANTEVTLLNMQGEPLDMQTIAARGTVDIEALPAGIYMLQLRQGNKQLVKKIVKK